MEFLISIYKIWLSNQLSRPTLLCYAKPMIVLYCEESKFVGIAQASPNNKLLQVMRLKTFFDKILV